MLKNVQNDLIFFLFAKYNYYVYSNGVLLDE